MLPVLFKIGPISMNSYGVMLMAGFIAGYFLIKHEFVVRGIPEDFAFTVFVLGLISAIIGSRLFHVFEYISAYSGENLYKVFRGSGFSWYGGLLLAATTTILVARSRKIHWAAFADSTAPALVIGYGFGRVGCLLSGDGCYGQPCSAIGLHWPVPLCMAFPNGVSPTTEAVVNTPIIEIAGAVLLFAYLQYMRRRITTPAGLFAQMLIIHAIMRFAVEFIRINPSLALGLSQAQWLSIAGVGIGVWLIRIGPAIEIPKPEKKKFRKK